MRKTYLLIKIKKNAANINQLHGNQIFITCNVEVK